MNQSHETRKAQVLAVLEANREEWVDGTALATAEVGGSEGLKRLRELRQDGYRILMRKHPDPVRDIWQYKLVDLPEATPRGADTPSPPSMGPAPALVGEAGPETLIHAPIADQFPKAPTKAPPVSIAPPKKKALDDAYVWKPFNLVYGPWYRYRVPDGHGGIIDAVVQPDMDGQRFFWSVRFSGPRDITKMRAKPTQEGGHRPSIHEAKQAAMEAIRLHRAKR